MSPLDHFELITDARGDLWIYFDDIALSTGLEQREMRYAYDVFQSSDVNRLIKKGEILGERRINLSDVPAAISSSGFEGEQNRRNTDIGIRIRKLIIG